MNTIENLELSAECPEIVNEFIRRNRKLKYDYFNEKLYHVVWTNTALMMREEFLRNKRMEEYRKLHPKKEITIDEKMNYYLRKKVGLVGKVGRPPKTIEEN